MPGYIGTPPNCRPECISSSDCQLIEACVNQKCVDPCPGTCGLNALCQVTNHNPICSCPPRYSGNPFTLCQIICKLILVPHLSNLNHTSPDEPVVEVKNPCQPSPCGPNSQCRDINGSPSCSCLTEFIGAPPNCRPECVSNGECPHNLACIGQKCKDPCPGVCGINADCRVVSHTPNCVCLNGYSGNPFERCVIPQRELYKGENSEVLLNDIFLAPQPKPADPIDPCLPSPCGANALCKEQGNAAACLCLPGFFGNPYDGCRPECTINSDCTSNKACFNNKCQDPCPGTCGSSAYCQVINHLPTCSCPPSYTGDPFVSCSFSIVEKRNITDFSCDKLLNVVFLAVTVNPCQPSPCGPNSQCRQTNGQAVCSCLPTYVGSPPSCRPECVVSSECPLDKACINQKCKDPCPGTCGINARCDVRNHSPICSCKVDMTGDPFVRCYPLPRKIMKSTFRTCSHRDIFQRPHLNPNRLIILAYHHHAVPTPNAET